MGERRTWAAIRTELLMDPEVRAGYEVAEHWPAQPARSLPVPTPPASSPGLLVAPASTRKSLV